jgi:hypothetical protein
MATEQNSYVSPISNSEVQETATYIPVEKRCEKHRSRYSESRISIGYLPTGWRILYVMTPRVLAPVNQQPDGEEGERLLFIAFAPRVSDVGV